eukprot:SM000099S25217  [mRNA]  locus=s99:215983:218179:- [translate_table: standard]
MGDRVAGGAPVPSLLVCLLLLLLASGASSSPESPHTPRCTWAPTPCPWFEGWYTRVVDGATGDSFAAVVGSMSATGESVVMLLASHGAGSAAGGSCQAGIDDPAHAATSRRRCPAIAGGTMLTYVSQLIVSDAKITTGGADVVVDPPDSAPAAVEWQSASHGYFVANASGTYIRLTAGSTTFAAVLRNQRKWVLTNCSGERRSHGEQDTPAPAPKAGRLLCSGACLCSPPGRTFTGKSMRISMSPSSRLHCTLGSSAQYSFTNASAGIALTGHGLGHEEKNWGNAFPAGHVWAQAFSEDNSVQLVLGAAYFSIGTVQTPYVASIGLRAPSLALDLRSTDLGTYFSRISVHPCEGRLEIVARTFTRRVSISFSAPPSTFSVPIFGPTSQALWLPMCQESFSAVARVSVERLGFHWLWAASSQPTEYRTKHAALEFGEEVMCSVSAGRN